MLLKISLKIGACPIAYKKKPEEGIIKAILEDIWILKAFNLFLNLDFMKEKIVVLKNLVVNIKRILESKS